MQSNTIKRYLLAIYELSDGGTAVRSVDIANRIHVSRASVVKSLKVLQQEGYINKEYYGNVQLTSHGVREANHLYTEYTLLYSYFLECLSIGPQAAGTDAETCLCMLTQESKDALIELALFTKGSPPPKLFPQAAEDTSGIPCKTLLPQTEAVV